MEKYNSSDTEKLIRVTLKQLEKTDNKLSKKLELLLQLTAQYHTEISILFSKRIEMRKETISSNNQKTEESVKQLKINLNKLLSTEKTGYQDIDSLNEKFIEEAKIMISMHETTNKVTNSLLEDVNKFEAEINEWYNSMVYFAVKSVNDDNRFNTIFKVVSGGALIALGFTGEIVVSAGAAILSAITLHHSEKEKFNKGKLTKLELEIRRYETAVSIVEHINKISTEWIKILNSNKSA